MRSIKRPKPYNRVRLWLVVGLFGIGFVGILAQLYRVQILQGAELQELAMRQYRRDLTLRPERGRILDRNGHVLATSVVTPSLYALPRHMPPVESTASQLADILHQPREVVRSQLTSHSPFVWLARQTTPEMVSRVQALEIKGIHVQQEPRRYYPKRHLAGQVLGFVGVDGQGLGGLEYHFDRRLSGQPRHVILHRDAVGRRVRLVVGGSAAPPQGADLTLTLDEWLQHLAEREIAAQVQRTRARSGLVVIVQPQTGDVLAMASYPFFNPNDFRDSGQQAYQRNRVVTDAIEPGSTFKIVVAAASLEEQTVSSRDLFFCEHGTMSYGGRRIRDHEPYGLLDFADVFVHSSNIGTVKISERLSSFRLYQYIRRFGFGEKSFVDFPGESAGYLRSPQEWSRFSHASLSIGQEIAVTPLQLTLAFAAVANGGVLMQPRLVQRIDDGQEVQSFPPKARWRVISQQTAASLGVILARVVQEGTGTLAAVEGYTAAGKTGTAQKSDPERGGYSRHKVVASFVGYAPVEAPQLVILAMLDEPQIQRWGGQAAAPVFRRIAQQALPYLQIPPSQMQTLRLPPPTGHVQVYLQGDPASRSRLIAEDQGAAAIRLAKTRE